MKIGLLLQAFWRGVQGVRESDPYTVALDILNMVETEV